MTALLGVHQPMYNWVNLTCLTCVAQKASSISSKEHCPKPFNWCVFSLVESFQSSMATKLMKDLWIYMKQQSLCVCVCVYSVSQKWVHPSHFCRYFSISLHGTTLTKWRFDTMKSSLCAAYITKSIYFPLKITQNITIKS